MQLIGKPELQRALASTEPLTVDDQEYRRDFANLMTLWYALRLIHAVPIIFPATQALSDETAVDLYNALYDLGFTFLLPFTPSAVQL